jgi:hypothetical protein
LPRGSKQVKECPRCGKEKEPPPPSGRRDYCKACSKQINKENYDKDPEKARTRSIIYYYEDLDRARESNRRNYVRHVDQNQQRYRDYARERRRQYPEIRHSINVWHRAQKILATPKWADRSRIVEIYREAIQKTLETGIKHEVDHIVPMRSKWVCGLHCEDNLQVITQTENQTKHNSYWPDMPDHLMPIALKSK